MAMRSSRYMPIKGIDALVFASAPLALELPE